MNKSKSDKARRAQKAKQRSAAKAKERERSRPARLAARSAEKMTLAKRTKVSSVPDMTDEEYTFWLCHGANYLASDYENGRWTPVFEGIYPSEFQIVEDAPTPPVPAPEDIAQTVILRYLSEVDDETEQDVITAKAVMAWTVMDKSVVRIYVHEARRRLLAGDPTCDVERLLRQPHQPTVWGVLQTVKTRLKTSASSPSTTEAATGVEGSAPLDTALPPGAVPEQP